MKKLQFRSREPLQIHGGPWGCRRLLGAGDLGTVGLSGFPAPRLRARRGNIPCPPRSSLSGCDRYNLYVVVHDEARLSTWADYSSCAWCGHAFLSLLPRHAPRRSSSVPHSIAARRGHGPRFAAACALGSDSSRVRAAGMAHCGESRKMPSLARHLLGHPLWQPLPLALRLFPRHPVHAMPARC